MTASPAHNLPVQLTSLVGRVRETAEIRRELARTRLLTLTGPGGVGKTRLALRAAEAELDAYPDGVWFVDLAGLQDSELVPQTVARALEVREQPGEPLLDTLGKAIRDRRLLLILDNCEHVLAVCVDLVDSLLRGCPQLRILVTSREVLAIGSERVWRVPSLGLAETGAGSTPSRVAESEAAALFIERASAIQPGISLTDQNTSVVVAEICRRLDGIPLAIELAAARVRHLAVPQIAAHLDDRFRLLTTGSRSAPTRQQTMRATIDWSYQLLSQAEQLLFDRCSVFSGGWTLEAAEAVVAGDGIDRLAVLNLLGGLVDKSLVVVELASINAVRYRMLETLREYGRRQLRRRGQREVESTERRHVDFVEELVDRAHAQFGSIAEGWLAPLSREQDNFRTALRQSIKAGHAEAAQRLAGGLFPFWLVRGHLSEGRGWLTEALAVPDTPRDRVGTALRAHTDAPNETSQAASPRHRARALHGLGTVAFGQGDYLASLDAFGSALQLWRQLGDETGVAFALTGLGNAESYRGNLVAARDLLEAGISAARGSGQPVALALGLAFLSRVELDRDDLLVARQLAEESLELASRCGLTRAACVALLSLGDVSYAEGDHTRADTLLHEARIAADRAGDPVFASFASAGLARLATDRGDYGAVCELLSESLRLALRFGVRRAMVHALEYAAALAAAMDYPADAVRIAAAADAARQIAGIPMRPMEQVRLAPLLASARARLGDAAAQAWQEGQSMPLDRSVASALEMLESAASVAPAAAERHGTASALPIEQRPAGLSPREVQVLRLLASGKTSKQIAAELITSVHTVNNQISSVYAKIGAGGKADAVSFAIRTGLV